MKETDLKTKDDVRWSLLVCVSTVKGMLLLVSFLIATKLMNKR